MVDVLVISGSMGAGKTTALWEASDILTARDIVHAAVDLDGLFAAKLPDTAAHIPGTPAPALLFQNLAAVWRNYANAGVTRVLIARAIELRSERDAILSAVPGARIKVVRLTADVTTMEHRVAVRDPGLLKDQFVARVAVLDRALDAAGTDDFTVANQDRTITAVASEILERAGWI